MPFSSFPLVPLLLFLAGAILAIWATERMLEGLVSLADGLRLSAFIVGAVLSGFEVENVAVGLAAGSRGTAPIALGSVFGGAIFLICVALGIAALFFTLEVQLPRSILLVFAASPVVAGISLIAPVTPRWTGVLLLVCFVVAIATLIKTSRHQDFLDSEEIDEAREKKRPLWLAAILTIFGMLVISLGGELVTRGAEGLIAAFGIPALLMGMVVSPAVIELEEVIRQAIPSKSGRHDVSAGNLVGTMLYFLLFNLGLIALITPVKVDPLVRQLDWPFLIAISLIVTALLWRGRVSRAAGLFLLIAYAAFVVLHVIFR